ncbi:hypothetical protein DFH07DRAFT_980648 [Mycena maculata]|uniref:Pyruvate carboxyltransferase domain-containing protein n=1 Tax=Mycena maculata TaxID=230809 RepID=A0AAD7K1T6_9AGAR|nr:hypothetical protein DFH07DRAFT_980648 [Mycena maculata]
MNALPSNFNIIEITLREGEQFANAFFDTETKIAIAEALDAFGVEHIELTSPLGLRSKILTHIRCNMDDARVAVETVPRWVDGVNVVMGTSSFLRESASALEVITFVKSKGIEIRFSSEDAFCSDLVDLLAIYQAVHKIGVHRVGVADAVGSIANAYTALEAGATHIDTTVLGIGERNGITPLGDLIACIYDANPELVKRRYNLPILCKIEDLVARAVDVKRPFMNPITYVFLAFRARFC